MLQYYSSPISHCQKIKFKLVLNYNIPKLKTETKMIKYFAAISFIFSFFSIFANEVNVTQATFQPYKTFYVTRNGSRNYFQISSKFPVFINKNNEPEINYNLYLAYSQKSIWVPSDQSGNNEDFLYSNYNPEVFYAYDFRNKFELPLLVQLGFEHESDGLGKRFDNLHREWNRIYINPKYSFYEEQLKVSFKLWYASLDMKYNPDILYYMGIFELKLSTNILKNYYQPKIEINIGKGNTPKLNDFNISIEHHLDLFNLNKNKFYVPFDIYTLFYSGYGSYLRSYNRRTQSFRVGLSYNM